ncbi:hypothetical protein QN277_022106 [Acacia crassicarpa]|uniref:Non-specific lipid-transfer protein n=1 Tax=Acacia crassicarpa TaxID=499986 RepID=A0AAE1JHQ4_9FABA|nr:hypothetical protein QN277_022106 [Acacia crassicarpa]
MKMAIASSMLRLAAGIVAAILVAVLISAPKQVGAIPCSVVIPKISPCRGYIDKSKRIPSQSCCDGVKDINDRSKTRQDRVEACKCIKQALSLMSKYDPNRIPLIPGKCRFSFSLPVIKSDTDCNK